MTRFPGSGAERRGPARASAHGGIRPDLGRYFRSTWEANYARYLNWLKDRGEIQGWDYEAETFEFPVRRGTRFYLPDFRVTDKHGRVEFHEVKGYMDQPSRTALARMARYYPEVKIIVIDGPAYRDIRDKVGGLIEGWETAGEGLRGGRWAGW